MTAKQNETLGRRIARMRLSHGMTQERLANIANVSAQAVSKWENDQSYPDILLLPVLAKTFGVTVDELLGIESVTPEQEAALEPTHVVRVPIDVDEAVEATTTGEVATEPDVEAEPEPEPVVEDEPVPAQDVVVDGPATCVRLHVIQGGREAVNIAIPLVAARLLSNIAEFVPEPIFEGIDLVGLARGAQNAGRGTLIDVDDGHDRVIVTLE
ncbi:MAG: helix-turn-helix domain-containing protein [Atopobiaceae bacterium]|nr:helix-turn-helix domain-containing protein [Atopobiaceae bacterium]